MAKLKEEMQKVVVDCQDFSEGFKEQGEKLAEILRAKSGSNVYADPKQLNYEKLGSANNEFSDKIENFMKQFDDRSLGKMAKEQVDEVLKEVHKHIFSAA